MPRIAKPLTDSQIKNAKPIEKIYELCDGNGLYVRIIPSGSKTFYYKYTDSFTKRRSCISLGSYPLVTLSEARKKRDELAKKLSLGEDIKLIKNQQRSDSLLSVAERWFKVKQSEITPDYAQLIWRSLENHVFSKLGDVPISLITARMAIDALEPLAESGKLEQVKRTCQQINMVMDYAVNIGMISSNATATIKKAFQAPKPKPQPSIHPNELPQLFRALDAKDTKPKIYNLILWQLHCMVRPGEARHAKWTEIDFDKKIWVIPADKMKRNKEHIVPLTRQALTILEKQKIISQGSHWVFPGYVSGKPFSENTANTNLKRAGYANRLTAHGMRSIASTAMNEIAEFSPDVIEHCLSHLDKNSVRRAYNRSTYLEQRRQAMQWWSNFIDSCRAGKLPEHGKQHLTLINA